LSLPALIAAMLRPQTYPHAPAAVELVQTHISYVFLAGSEVYKIKKPVRFSFLDFSTLDQRRLVCHEEVRLNRRLAPDTYLGVVAICPGGSGYRFGPDNDPAAVEYAVHMRRLPAERMLDYLLDRAAVSTAMIDQIARRLARFHRDAAAGPEMTANGDPAAVWAVLQDNFSGVRRFRDITIPARDDDAVQTFSSDFLRRNDVLFRQRQAQHRVRECHGDLHAEHICFAPEPIIFDCVEFSPRFRYCDTASEIAFLAMDLDFHGHPALAAHLVAEYARCADDPDLPRLVPFYQCYRAYVRGKVDSLKSAEEEVEPAERERARTGARRHFALAYRYTWAYSRALVVIAGLSGTGKSAVAAALQSRTGFVHINSDVVRKRLAGLDTEQRAVAAYGAGWYSSEHSERTYEAMLAEARECLAAGRGVLLDATFQRRASRATARALAAAQGVPFLLVECMCSDDEVRRRLAERQQSGAGPSDADWSVHLEQRRRFEPIRADEGNDHLLLDTAVPLPEIASAVEQALRLRLERKQVLTP
jgi:uncharacterized protein